MQQIRIAIIRLFCLAGLFSVSAFNPDSLKIASNTDTRGIQALISLAQETEKNRALADAYLQLSEIYEKQNKKKLALEYFIRYNATEDSLFKEEKRKQINDMEAKYENEKKQKEIALLKKNTQLQELEIDKQRSNMYAIGGSSLFLLLLIAGIYNRYHLRQKARHRSRQEALQKQLSDLEQKALRTQMNPHFIFNSMGSIQGLMLEEKVDAAGEYLTKFARLLKQVLENSGKKYISLSDEINSLELYLSLEQMRSEHKFQFSLAIADDLDGDKLSFPPLLIQPFVENAIWHGIKHKKGSGNISIDIQSNDPDHLICRVTDDGIGREKARSLAHSQHRSLGMKISRQRIALMGLSEQSDIRIIDLYNEHNEAAGTRVELVLPKIAATT